MSDDAPSYDPAQVLQAMAKRDYRLNLELPPHERKSMDEMWRVFVDKYKHDWSEEELHGSTLSNYRQIYNLYWIAEESNGVIQPMVFFVDMGAAAAAPGADEVAAAMAPGADEVAAAAATPGADAAL